MIYQWTWKMVIEDRKHQTRRLAKYGERARCIIPGDHVRVVGRSATWPMLVEPDHKFQNDIDQATITAIRSASDRLMWRKGQIYTVQPGRGQEAVGYHRHTGYRAERLQSISSEDAFDELGEDLTYWIDRIVDSPLCDQFLDEPDMGEEFSCLVYKYVWNLIHTRKGERWSDNPPVWIIDFKPEHSKWLSGTSI